MKLSPADFGAPSTFNTWRDGQYEAVWRSRDSKKRFVAHAMPTGSGKSLVYMVAKMLIPGRGAILTSTKGLQEQLNTEFKETGLVDIRGQANYVCVLDSTGKTMVDKGECHDGLKCTLKDKGCLYYDQYKLANRSELVVTNYAYWLAIHEYGEGLGLFDYLVLDEAHSAGDELLSFLEIRFGPKELEEEGIKHPGLEVARWRSWALDWHYRLKSKLVSIGRRTRARYRKHLRNMVGRMKTLAQIKGKWIKEVRPGGWLVFSPVWMADYCEAKLFRGIERVDLFSATINHTTLKLLGLREDAYEFYEYPSPFAVENRSITVVPGMRLNWRSTEADLRAWVQRIDSMVDLRRDRKGILHTVSYSRARFFLSHTRHRDLAMSHDPSTTGHVVPAFKARRGPALLVSPSLGTGWNFPYEECEYAIIGKVPYPDTRGGVMSVRCEEFRGYADYLASQELIQTAGRSPRAVDDRCEIIIVDDLARWFIWGHPRLFPRWFKEACSIWTQGGLPPPPEKLRRKRWK